MALTTYPGDATVIERYEYDAYGQPYFFEPNLALADTQASDYNNAILFTGRRVDLLDDDDLKLQYSRNRYYDYHTGRWLTQDPIGCIIGMNLYEYVYSRPVSRIDPEGLTGELWSCAYCLGALTSKWTGNLSGCTIGCAEEDIPGLSYWKCLDMCLGETLEICELWRHFKETPGEWVGLASCVACGLEIIALVMSEDPPPECQDEGGYRWYDWDEESCPNYGHDFPPDQDECKHLCKCEELFPYKGGFEVCYLIWRTYTRPCACEWFCPGSGNSWREIREPAT